MTIRSISRGRWFRFMALALPLVCGMSAAAAERTTNSLGMELVPIKPGIYVRGSEVGDYDEKPVHAVTITQAFRMSATEVTNAQYEQFDPEHRSRRGRLNLSTEDDDAVIDVSWEEAMAFCAWLSKKEGKPYRLPTEAEWEYACRAGTATLFHTGDELPAVYHKEQGAHWSPKRVSLKVGQTPANAWGLYDMHGNVEEWCLDWYGPYPTAAVKNPAGPRQGLFRVTRGGSHNTTPHYLRSANRSGALPDDRHWLIGFRVVQAPMPALTYTEEPPTPIWAKDVSQRKAQWPRPNNQPFFAEPIPFVKIDSKANGPLYYRHNHCPDIVVCPNGDLLATWYSTREEPGRELTVVAARLRHGADAWDEADLFYKVPDRNMHATSIWHDGKGTIYHFNGIGVSHGWERLALMFRTSTDNGVTWSSHRWIDHNHHLRHMPIAGVIQMRDGTIVVPCDAVTGGSGGTAIHISSDGGETWIDPGINTEPLRPKYGPGVTGGSIAGIHAGIVELKDGRLMAFGRGDAINGRMPVSYSSDKGRTWTYKASAFPPIAGGQRLTLMRLAEGPLLLVSFTHHPQNDKDFEGMELICHDGEKRRAFGMFAALSYDEGETWPIQRLVADGKTRELIGGAWTGQFKMDATHAEPRGYLASTQSPDGTIHLISSGQHYRFNLAWLEAK